MTRRGPGQATPTACLIGLIAALTLTTPWGCTDPAADDDSMATDDDAGDDDTGDDDAGDDDSGDDDAGDDDIGDDDIGDDDTGGVDCSEPLAAPTDRLWPIPGELFYAQLGLGGVTSGEAAVAVGPDGTILVIDTGNDAHDDDIRDLVDLLVQHMNADGGYPGAPFPADSVDHILITHFHADHADGIEDLLQAAALTGRVIHRGFLDLHPAASEGSVEKVCTTLAAHPGAGVALCEGLEAAPCDPAQWSGSYPSTGCPGLDAGDLELTNDSGPAFLRLGGDARLEIAGAGATLAGDRYEDLVGPLLTEDINGENARSVVSVLRHGPFRMMIAGDLTGGGSDTDPVEAFVADRLALASDLDARGVDVMQANHHGRNTSSSVEWVDRLLPADGYSRTMVIGVCAASTTSPHEETLHTVLDDDRLADGLGWTTLVAALGDDHPLLMDAGGGHILLTTLDGGATYQVQALGTDGQVIAGGTYHAVRTCL